MDDLISRQEAIDVLRKKQDNGKGDMSRFYNTIIQYDIEAIMALPSAHPEWNNHTVACLLTELFDDTCACNYNGIDEWLPEKCELLESCPNPVGVACWEQFLKHRTERGTDE